MKYKTLCRLLVKLMGLYFLAFGAAYTWNAIVQVISFLERSPGMPWSSWLMWVLNPLGYIGIGAYLFFGGKWVVDKLIPSNRPYCHECGYDLTGTVGNVCAECGTTFKPIVRDVEPHH